MPQLPALRAPRSALLNFDGIGNALSELGQVRRQREQQEFQRDQLAKQQELAAQQREFQRQNQLRSQNRADQAFGLQKDRFGLDQQRFASGEARAQQNAARAAEAFALKKQQSEFDFKQKRIQQITGVARTIDSETDPAKKERFWQAYAQREPELFEALPPEVRNPIDGPKFLMAQGGDGEGAVTFGRSGSVFQDGKGNQFTVQFGSDGSRKILPVDGLTRERGVKTIDTGTGTELIDAGTGRTVRNVEKDIVGEEVQKAKGKLLGDRVKNARKSKGTLFSLEQQWKTVDDAIDDAVGNIGRNTAGFVGSAMSNVPGTPAFDLARTIDTIKSNIGFDKLQDMRNNSPTGGALGQVSEFENKLLQSVRNSLEQGQSPEQLKNNLLAVQRDLKSLQLERRKAFSEDFGNVDLNTVPQQTETKRFIFNPETGQLEAQ